MSAPPVLSLCVPTFNRAPLLAQALEAIAAQVGAGRAAQVEIVVCDNASTDDTAQVVERLGAAHPGLCLRFHQQPENLGPDANIYQAVKLAGGEFVYILSDDDVLLPGAVAKLLDLIREYPDADALTLNIRSFTVRSDEESAPWFSVVEDTVKRDPATALAAFRPMQLMFLSVFAFRRALVTADYSDKIGTNLLQSYLFVDVLAQGRGLVVTAQPFLAQRKDNTGGWAFWRVMTTNLRGLWDYAAHAGFDRPLLARLLVQHLETDLYTATRYYQLTGRGRALGLNAAANRDGARRLLQVYGPRPLVLFVYLPLMLAPEGFWPGLRLLYKKLRPSSASLP